MQNLLDAVKQVKQTIQAHKAELMNNEALTRYALVDVILNALGWDVHNPAKVFPEYNKGVGGRADYALLGENNKPVAVLEAKKYGNLATNDLIQVTTYAFHSGIKYSLATDGNLWIVADAFKQVQFTEKEVMRLNLETEPENLLLIKLVSLMPANLNAANNAFFPNTQSTIVAPANPTQAPNIPPQPSIPGGTMDANWKPLSLLKEAVKPPTKLKFPDGTVVLTGSKYSEVLKQIAEWLIRAQKLPQPPIEDCFKGKWYLINTTPIHKSGIGFSNKHQYRLSNGLFLEASPNAINFRTNAIWLLQKADVDPDTCYFQ